MFTQQDYGKPLSPAMVEYLQIARQPDFVEVGRKIKRSSETIKALARGNRSILERNQDCIIELVRHLEKKTAPARREIKKLLQ